MSGVRDGGIEPVAGEVAALRGRGSMTALLAVVAVFLGGDLFEDVDDVGSTVVRFVLVVLATSALTAELTRQAQRGMGDPAASWARTDTAIVATLAAIAALLMASFVFVNAPNGEHVTAACFATLYLVLASYFCHVRRKSLPKR